MLADLGVDGAEVGVGGGHLVDFVGLELFLGAVEHPAEHPLLHALHHLEVEEAGLELALSGLGEGYLL